MPTLHFLEASQPLTKQFSVHADGSIDKTSYPNAFEFTSHETHVRDLPEFLAQIQQHALAGHCLLKGQLSRPLIRESRAGSTNPNGDTDWICLDFDGLPNTSTVDQILGMMGVGDVSYVLQWSASMGIGSTDLRCHVFMLLDRPIAAPMIKQWLVQLNHNVPFLSAAQRLTKTNMALTWGLDITACQNDKLLYIAPPVLKGLRNPLGRRLRYELVRKAKDQLVFPAHVQTPEVNKQLTLLRVEALREKEGLPKRKYGLREYKNVEVMAKPDEAMLTGIKADRGFIYINLNGGDSWGYYHPEGDCEILYNFKGEPNYAIKDLLPDYYKQAKAAAASDAQADAGVGAFVADAQQQVLLAFRERRTGAYLHGTYSPDTDELDLSPAKNEKQIRDFCMQYGMPMGDYVPIWDRVFDPHMQDRVDVDRKIINMYAQTTYMRNVGKRAPAQIPKVIRKILRNMLAEDDKSIAHFLNWLAYIVQKRERPQTAWVLYGVEGTGKGMFASRVLRPLFGMNQTAMRRGSELDSIYNGYMQHTSLVFFDEAHIAEMKNAEGAMATLRNFITEPTVSLRKMHQDAVEIPNYAAIICLSNKPNVIMLQKHDRRWNVGPWQDSKLSITQEEIDAIPGELQGFFDFLAHYQLDEAAARTPLDTGDRARLISTTSSSADDVAHALAAKAADMGFFIDQLPSDATSLGYKQATSLADYKRTLKTIILRAQLATGGCKVSRDELHTMFNYTVGNMPETAHKFTKFLAHRHIHTTKVRIGDKTVYGISVEFKDVGQFETYLAEHFAEAPAPQSKIVPLRAKK